MRGAVSGLTSEGVLVTRDEGGEEERLVPSDAVVLATGFDLAETAAPFRVVGRGGVAIELILIKPCGKSQISFFFLAFSSFVQFARVSSEPLSAAKRYH